MLPSVFVSHGSKALLLTEAPAAIRPLWGEPRKSHGWRAFAKDFPRMDVFGFHASGEAV